MRDVPLAALGVKALCDLGACVETRGAGLLAGGFELVVAFGLDGLGAACEEVVGGDVADGAVEANAIVVVNEALDDGARLLDGAGVEAANGVVLEGLVPALDL